MLLTAPQDLSWEGSGVAWLRFHTILQLPEEPGWVTTPGGAAAPQLFDAYQSHVGQEGRLRKAGRQGGRAEPVVPVGPAAL